jgi:hypothetical protein
MCERPRIMEYIAIYLIVGGFIAWAIVAGGKGGDE